MLANTNIMLYVCIIELELGTKNTTHTMKALAHIYKATDCADMSDCNYAIQATKEAIAIANRSDKPVKALYKRLLSLEKRLIWVS